jgi:hypothetical protein
MRRARRLGRRFRLGKGWVERGQGAGRGGGSYVRNGWISAGPLSSGFAMKRTFLPRRTRPQAVIRNPSLQARLRNVVDAVRPEPHWTFGIDITWALFGGSKALIHDPTSAHAFAARRATGAACSYCRQHPHSPAPRRALRRMAGDTARDGLRHSSWVGHGSSRHSFRAPTLLRAASYAHREHESSSVSWRFGRLAHPGSYASSSLTELK